MKNLGLFLCILFIVQCSHSNPPENLKKSGIDKDRSLYRFAIVSDLNGSYGSIKYSEDVKRAVDYIKDSNNNIDFVLSTGDMVAGQKDNLDYALMWEAFHNSTTRRLLQSDIVLYPSPGNHDAYKSRILEREHYKKTWLKEIDPQKFSDFQYVPDVEQNFPFQYAFRIGSALFVGLDDTAAQPWSNKTLQWLEQVLEKESSAKQKFIFGHVPLLPFAFNKEREYAALGSQKFLDNIETLFAEHKVSAFFSGHSHVYYPGVRKSETQYISVPLLGSGKRFLITQQEFPLSEAGFLVIQFKDDGSWGFEHIKSKNYKITSPDEFPEFIQMPKNNSNLCAHCAEFPDSHFLNSSERIIYKRHDL